MSEGESCKGRVGMFGGPGFGVASCEEQEFGGLRGQRRHDARGSGGGRGLGLYDCTLYGSPAPARRSIGASGGNQMSNAQLTAEISRNRPPTRGARKFFIYG
eukprot:scaffold70015_cov34-Tisochrysis_lutea.AAC.3